MFRPYGSHSLPYLPFLSFTATPSIPSTFRRRLFFFLLLLLAGDIHPNPGPTSLSHLTLTHCNARSAASISAGINKPAVIQEHLLNHHTDLFAITETWLTPNSPQPTLNSLTPPGYSLLHNPRLTGTGGGVGLLYKSHLHIKPAAIPSFPSFESLCVILALPSTSITILIIYRPPSLSKSNFYLDFSTLLESLSTTPSEFLIIGDFNFHVDAPVPSSDSPFLDLLETFSLSQHISFPTHTSSHILDLLITRSSSKLVASTCPIDLGISDHLAVCSTLTLPVTLRPARVTKTIRNFRSINTTAFSRDILNSLLYSNPATTLSSYLNQFNTSITAILNKHAPEKTITCNERVHKPFITKEIRSQKAKRSKLETIFRRTRSSLDLLNMKTQARHVAKLISSARSSYFKSLISLCSSQPKKLWSCLDSLLSRSTPKTLPPSSSHSHLASSFLDFFNGKIAKLTSAFPPISVPHPCELASPPPQTLSSFFTRQSRRGPCSHRAIL
jgi:Endonuclease/Exonuclease/phosphatase family